MAWSICEALQGVDGGQRQWGARTPNGRGQSDAGGIWGEPRLGRSSSGGDPTGAATALLTFSGWCYVSNVG